MLKLTRWTIAHRRIVVVSWIVLALGVLGVSQAVGKRNANNFSLPNTTRNTRPTCFKAAFRRRPATPTRSSFDRAPASSATRRRAP